MELNEQQNAVVNNRGGELLVAAAAGSGKTSVLVERLLQRIDGEEGANITDFIVITFTKEAAGELKQRISKELSKRLAINTNNRHLRRQLTLVYQAQICTIHSFCSRLIREHGHYISVSPSFVQCSEGDALLLKKQIIDTILNKWYDNVENSSDDGFISLINTLAFGNDDRNLEKILLEIHNSVQSHASPQEWLKEQRTIWENLDNIALDKTDWGILMLQTFEKQVKQAIKELEYVLELCEDDDFVKINYYSGTEEVCNQFVSLGILLDNVLIGENTWDDMINAIEKLSFPRPGMKKSKEMDAELKEEVKNRRSLAYDRVRKFSLGQRNEIEINNLRGVQVSILTLIDLVLDFSTRYQLEKEQRNWLDYNDLEHFALKLLVNPDGNPTRLGKNYDSQVLELMVDEYQDTNRVQNAIFDSITSGGKKLFMVGDMKQAIYRFRLADPSIFNGKFQSFHSESSENSAKEGEARSLTLSKNFRSRSEVLDTCNDFFADVMSPEFGEVDYKRDGMLAVGAEFPENVDGYYDTELNLLDLEGYFEESKNPVDRYFAEARWVAKKIRSMIDEKFQVSDLTTKTLRDVEYSDFMLLLRSKNALAPFYILAFAEQNIPLYLKEGESIFESIEVNVALSLLKILDNPRQDVALVSVLRSPLFGFSPDDLAMLRGKRYGCFYDAMVAVEMEETGDSQRDEVMKNLISKRDSFLGFLDKKRRETGEYTPQQLLWTLYKETNIMGIFGNLAPGNERQNHLLEFYDLIGTLERGGTATVFSCLYQLEQLEQQGKLPKSSNKQREGEAVVMHSIHSSKGLEKPVVILAGLCKQFNTQDLQRSVLFHPKYGMGSTGFDRKQQMKYSTLPRNAIKMKIHEETLSEELRLLYVAMTRAKEKLILSTILPKGKKDVEKLFKGVTKPLNSTLLLEKKSLQEVILTYFLTRLEEGLALYRWIDPSSSGAISLDPNFSPSHASKWKLSMVDYRDLEVDIVSEKTVLGDNITERKDFSSLKEQCTIWLNWEYPYAAAVDTPSKLTATQTKGRNWLEEAPLEEENVEIEGEKRIIEQETGENEEEKIIKHLPTRKPSFVTKSKKMTAAQRGTAIHLLMEYLEISPDLDCSVENIATIKDELLEQRKVTQAQYDVISPEQIVRFLDSTWGQGARNSVECRQEFKFSLLVAGQDLGYETEEKMLLQGVVDCWYVDEQGEIVLIDFKSDKIRVNDLEAKAKEHESQMKTYSSALERMTGKVVKQKVLWFFEIDQGVLVK